MNMKRIDFVIKMLHWEIGIFLTTVHIPFLYRGYDKKDIGPGSSNIHRGK